MNNRDLIEHVVVLMLENRSFDQMLGAFQTVHDGLDGVDPNSPLTSRDDDGNEYEQKPTAARIVSHDPHHDLDSVLRQIGAPPAIEGRDLRGSRLRRFVGSLQQAGWGIFSFLWGLWRNYRRRRDRAPAQAMMAPAAPAYGERFVAEYARTYPDLSKEAIEQIMAYFPVDELPALHALARGFTVCDRWFSSVPGPTWTNRFFLHSGTSMGVTSMPEGKVSPEGIDLYEQRTIYDELNRVGKPWRIYFHDVPQSLALIHQWRPENRNNYLPIDEFEQDAAKAASKFPAFVVIEPQYLGADPNDDHPPHDTMLAQGLIARVYNAIRQNEELWNSTLLIVTYDEHGGFYDHVEPPTSVCPDAHRSDYSFDRLGVRVPAVLVSPWLDAGVFSEQLDHTSVGKYLSEKWGINPLGERMRLANSLGSAFGDRNTPRTDTPERISVSSPQIPAIVAEPVELNENQVALLALSRRLEEERRIRQEGDGRIYTTQELPDPNDITALRERIIRFIEV